MSELPSGWSEAGILELAEMIRGVTYTKADAHDAASDGLLPVLRANNIANRKFDLVDLVFVPSHLVLQNQRIQSGDVIIATSSGSINVVGKAAQASQAMDAGFGAFCAGLRPTKQIDPKYFGHFFSSDQYRKTVSALARGVNINNLKREHFESLQIPLPPLNEQKRIAAKLDALLQRVDACRAHLERVPLLLKRFRQAVLAAAMSGQLTEGWRENIVENPAAVLINLIKLEKSRLGITMRGAPAKPSIDDLPFEVELPNNWVVTCFDELADASKHALKAGPFGSTLKKDMYVPSGFKIYGQEQVISGDETFGDYFISETKYRELETCAVKAGDILISLVGTIGKVLVLSADALPGIINPRLVKLSLDKRIHRQFIALYLQSEFAQGFFRKRSHGGTMDILNLGLLRELPILLPPLTEQAEIVRRVETLFACADRLEARYHEARAQVEQLTPALLAKAFRGELVPQDPSDEPAIVLLARLQAERANAPTKRQSKGNAKGGRGATSEATSRVRAASPAAERNNHTPAAVPLPFATGHEPAKEAGARTTRKKHPNR